MTLPQIDCCLTQFFIIRLLLNFFCSKCMRACKNKDYNKLPGALFCFVDFIGNLTTYKKLNKYRSKASWWVGVIARVAFYKWIKTIAIFSQLDEYLHLSLWHFFSCSRKSIYVVDFVDDSVAQCCWPCCLASFLTWETELTVQRGIKPDELSIGVKRLFYTELYHSGTNKKIFRQCILHINCWIMLSMTSKTSIYVSPIKTCQNDKSFISQECYPTIKNSYFNRFTND